MPSRVQMLIARLLWRCDPLDLCSDRPSETQKAIFSRAGALHLSLLSHKRQELKVCVPLFLFSRRNKGDPLRGPRNERHGPNLQGTTDTPGGRYVRSFYSVMLIIYRQLSSSDRTRLNPRPMCGRRSIFSTLGSTGVNTVDS